MKSNLLLNRICLIQTQYKELLTALLPKIKSQHLLEALDEISLFWIRHMGAVQLYLRTWFASGNGYVFTAATCMDFDDGEHLPFLLMGDKHILDDPLSSYTVMLRRMQEGEDKKWLANQIIVTAECNLRVLENVSPDILILPLRLINQSASDDSLYKIGEQIFVSLFNGIDSLNDYFKKCDSIDDIIRHGREDIENLVIFSEYDNVQLSFKERFNAEVARSQYVINQNKTDVVNFYHLVFGCIMQAVDVITSCTEYNCIPYIRYPVALHYVSLFLEGLLNSKQIKSIHFRMGVAFIVSKIVNTEKLLQVDLKEFIIKTKEYNFSNKLLQRLNANGISENNYLNHRITPFIIEELEGFYSMLS